MMMTLNLKKLPKTARPQPRGMGIPSGVPFPSNVEHALLSIPESYRPDSDTYHAHV